MERSFENTAVGLIQYNLIYYFKTVLLLFMTGSGAS